MGATYIKRWERGHRHRIAHHAARRHAQRKRKRAHCDANWFKRRRLAELDAWECEQWSRAVGAVLESRKAVQRAPAPRPFHRWSPDRWQLIDRARRRRRRPRATVCARFRYGFQVLGFGRPHAR